MDSKGKVVRLRAPGGGSSAEGTQSIDRAVALLVLVSKAGDDGASLTQLVVESGLKQPTVHRLLTALTRGGLVEQDEDTKRYHLGYESYVFGMLAAGRFGIHRLAQGSVARLAHVSQDTAFLTIRRGNFTVCLHREEGTYPIRAQVLSVGDRHPLGVGAGSIAILAALPDEEIDAVLRDNAAIYRDSYPAVSPARLRQLVAETRERGFAAHRGLIHPGSWGIGVVVRDESGQPSAALSIGAIESRLDEARQEQLAPLMREEADKLHAQLSSRAQGRAAPAGRRGPSRHQAPKRAARSE
jgi:DNA-binding IclR family transcriptional regulator